MKTGIIFYATARQFPTVGEKRKELIEKIIPRIQEKINADSFSDTEIIGHNRNMEDIEKYEFIKSLVNSGKINRYSLSERKNMMDYFNKVDGDIFKLGELTQSAKIDYRVKKFLERKEYLEKGVPSMSDEELGEYLLQKQRESFQRHDPIDAFPEEKMGPDCPHPKMYGILFDGLALEEAQSFCKPLQDRITRGQGRIPLNRIILARNYHLNYDILPEDAKHAISLDLVPTLQWDPSYMVLKNG